MLRKGAVVFVLALAAVLQVAATRLPRPVERPPAATGLFRLPLHFEPNRGQAPPGVRFLARGQGYAFLLSDAGAELRLASPASPASVRMRLAGAGASPLFPAQPLPGRVHYYTGKDPRAWVRDVPTFARVQARQVYPGVDLVYYGNQRRVEYDFEVAPGADPGRIALEFIGARDAELAPNGDLLLRLSGGELRQKRPVAYQEVGGRRVPVEAWYVLKREARSVRLHASRLTLQDPLVQVCVNLGPYDPTRRLVIDPTLEFSTFLGGGAADEGTAIGVDPDKNLYITGFTASTNFPEEQPAQSTLGGGQDAFVTKMDASGTFIHYSTFLGGAGTDRALGIGVRPGGSCGVAGFTTSANFPTLDPEQPAKGAGEDAFVTQLDAEGQLLSSTFWGGAGSDRALAAAVDVDGNVHAAGFTTSPDFPLERPFQAQLRGPRDAWTARFAGGEVLNGQLLHSTYLGGSGSDEATGISVDADRRPWLSGFTTSEDFPQFPFSASNAGGEDAFAVQLEFNGSFLRFSSLFGGGANDRALAISALQPSAVLNSDVFVALTGFTTSNNFPVTPTAFQATRAGGEDAFLALIERDRDGEVLLRFFTFLGGTGNDRGLAVSMPGLEAVFLGGSTTSVNFPTFRAAQPARGGGTDGFITRIDGPVRDVSNQHHITWSTFLGGAGVDRVQGLAAEGSTFPFDVIGAPGRSFNTFVAGATASTNFPRVGALDGSLGGASDAFAAKIGPGVALPPTGASAAALSRSQLALSWNDTNDDEIKYEIFDVEVGQLEVIEDARFVAAVPANTTRFTEKNLTPQFSRAYAVRAINPEGPSAFSNVAFARTFSDRPDPLNLTAARAVASDRVLIEWDAVSQQFDDRVVVFRGEGGGSVVPHGLARVVDQEFEDRDAVRPDTVYTYRIAVESSGGRSALSPPLSVTTLAAPTNLRTLPTALRALRLEWQDNSSREAGYRVERRQGGSFVLIRTVGANVTAVTDTSLPLIGSQFTYRVVAFSGQNVSSFSNQAVGILAPPPAPTNLRGIAVVAGSSASVTLTWDDNSTFESAFQVQRRLPGGIFTTLGNAGANAVSFTDTGVPLGTTVEYRVRALNGVIQSGFSNIFSLNIPPPQVPNAPANLNATPFSDSAVLLRWEDRSQFEDTFRVERRIPGSAFREVGSVARDVSSFVDTGLKPRTRYTYRVRGVNSLGPGEYSGPATTTTRGGDAGRLRVPEELLFGKARLGRSVERVLVIRNASARRRLRVALGDPEAPYALAGAARYLVIPAGETRKMTVRFTPTKPGLALGRLLVASSDGSRPKVSVRLIGEAVP